MGRDMTRVLCLSGLVMEVAAQTAQGMDRRALPQWLTGLIAVAGFLFLVFVAFLVNKAWCQRTQRTDAEQSLRVIEYVTTNGDVYDVKLDDVRSSDHQNAYENVAADRGGERVTVM
ncbi:PDZK1-interacting protein 1 [Lampris incognitus]|uniref:PDZK1-interacting protein 1 n=1 Tax=Lampris incognitus TaxID=2546036 RepID=UPI0024B553C9|nr:PDZK1-interacting protein 1 [Lampris incognitus]